MTETMMKQPNRIKPVASYTLDPEVITKVSEIADSLGLSDSALVNMQLRIAFGLLDSDAKEFMSRGMPR